jgi:tRNA (guanine37-N1)-methyltransferase
MWFSVITLFPEMIVPFTQIGVVGRAVQDNTVRVDVWNPRDFTNDKHQTVDDRPYGGGPGMVMKIQPVLDAIKAAKKVMGDDTKVVYMSPQGKRLDQRRVNNYVHNEKIILLAGRYEGIDERLIEQEVDEECSIGDFVLSGGELPALTLIDAISRQLPGVLGSTLSAPQDSFFDGLLDCPHYTRPEVFEGKTVPDVLLSGNHLNIERWRKKQSLGRTWLRRPDLLEKLELDSEQQTLLAEFKRHADNYELKS